MFMKNSVCVNSTSSVFSKCIQCQDGGCALSVAAPTLWTRLPADIRNVSSFENFKSILKTRLFNVAFTDK